MSHTIVVRHNFEAGHRLPHLPGKCQSLHGHSFWATVTIEVAELPQNGIVVDYGTAKRFLRGWIDEEWDHGLILGSEDPLAHALRQHGKVYTVPGWPTVETLAWHLAETTKKWCAGGVDLALEPTLDLQTPELRCTRVHIQETHVNAAEWVAA